MKLIPIIAYMSTIGVLGLYALSRHQKQPRIFDWANVIFFAPLTYCNLVTGATWAAVISFTFGIIGVTAVLTQQEQDDGTLST